MSFLKKLGQVVATGLQIVLGFGPLVKQTIPGTKDDKIIDQVSDTLTDIAGITQSVEVVSATLGDKALTGPQKLAAASAQAEQIILSKIVLGKKIQDPALFKEGVSDIVNGVVKIQNSLHADNLATTDVKN